MNLAEQNWELRNQNASNRCGYIFRCPASAVKIDQIHCVYFHSIKLIFSWHDATAFARNRFIPCPLHTSRRLLFCEKNRSRRLLQYILLSLQ